MAAHPVERLTYTVPEAAEAIGISDTQARRMIAAGLIPSMRIGRRVLVSRAELAAWVDEHKNTTFGHAS
jgi:excisionase family DNA binding protein